MVVRVLRHYVPLSLVALGFAEALIFFAIISRMSDIRAQTNKPASAL